MSIVTNDTTNTAGATSTSQKSNSTLGKDDFLKLLVTQLEYQDPMNPMDNTQFVAQMAQFSSLEQMQNMSQTMSNLQGTTLLGKYVYWTDDKGVAQAGMVSSVETKDGVTYLVAGSQEVELGKISSIVDPLTTFSQLQNINNAQMAAMIGKKVYWTDDKKVEHSGTVTSVKFANGQTQMMVGDTALTLDKITKIE